MLNRVFTITLSALVGAFTAAFFLWVQKATPRKSRPLSELSPTWWAAYEADVKQRAQGEVNEPRILREQYEFTTAIIREALKSDLTEKEADELAAILSEEVAEVAAAGSLAAFRVPDSFEVFEGGD